MIDLTRPFTPAAWRALARAYARANRWKIHDLCLRAAWHVEKVNRFANPPSDKAEVP
jgi:hypothetical protein